MKIYTLHKINPETGEKIEKILETRDRGELTEKTAKLLMEGESSQTLTLETREDPEPEWTEMDPLERLCW